MIKVGVTGGNGFIGKHLVNTIQLSPQEFELIQFNRSWFDNEELLISFIRSCDIIIHMAGINRDSDENIKAGNIGMAEKLTNALNKVDLNTVVLFAGTTQEKLSNVYGDSKREARNIFKKWASDSKGKFTGLLIPNVFGPFGKPEYNSFISTFCHRIVNGQTPEIKVDSIVNLIYVGELVDGILSIIRNGKFTEDEIIEPTCKVQVSEVLALLKKYKNCYIDNGQIPELNRKFEIQLFNTFRSYINLSNFFPRKYVQHTDPRGSFVELMRTDAAGQVSFSTTVPGITRGNHFHTRKVERFSVIRGEASISMRKIGNDEVIEFILSGEEPTYVDMPVWYTHNIKNIGKETLYTIFWINEPYNPEDPDTYMETV